MTVEPGVIGVPGVVTVPGLPGVIGGNEHRVPDTGSQYRVPIIRLDRYRVLPGPDVTGTCSEGTGRLTGDC